MEILMWYDDLVMLFLYGIVIGISEKKKFILYDVILIV